MAYASGKTLILEAADRPLPDEFRVAASSVRFAIGFVGGIQLKFSRASPVMEKRPVMEKCVVASLSVSGRFPFLIVFKSFLIVS